MDKRVIVGGMAVVLAVGLGYWLTRPSSTDPRDEAVVQDPGARTGTAGAADGTGRAPAAPATLTGTVVARSGGAPVAGALVQLTWASDDDAANGSADAANARVARTDAAGRFSLAEVMPGQYTVSAAALGWVPAVGKQVVLEAGGSESVELELVAGGGSITGTVSDVSGGPVAEAIVRFVPVHGVLSVEPAESFAAMTDADGKFSLSAADGMYQATADHLDYVPETQRVEIRGGERALAFALTPGGAIEGVVLDADGKAVPNAAVAYAEERVVSLPGVGAMNLGGRRGGALAGADGRFRITGLSSGAIRLTARGSGGVSAEDTLVGMAIGETVSGVELYLEDARRIRGLVVDKATGGPVAGVMVEAMGDRESRRAEAKTGDDGSFSISDVGSGGYRLVATGGSYLTNGFGLPVSVADSDVDGLRLEVSKGYTVRGRVEPAARAEVGLRLGEEGRLSRRVLRLGSQRTQSDGSFELGPLAAGAHTIDATAEDGRTGTARVTIKDADLDDLVVTLEPGASVSGTVVDASGNPVTDATVMLGKRGGDRNVSMIVNGVEMTAKRSPTHTDGSFVIRGLEAGDYGLSVKDSDLELLPWAGKRKGDQPLSLAKGQDRKGLVLRVQTKDGVIKGVALGPDGSPMADAWVRASASLTMPSAAAGPGDSDDGGGPGSRTETRMVLRTGDGGGGGGFGGIKPVLTGADGRFEFRGLRRGAYDLIGRGLSGGARGYARGVETGSDVSLQLRALASVEGTVTQGGNAIQQFHLELVGQSRREKSVRDDGGEFALRLVDPGKQTLRVRSAEGSAELEIEVAPGKKTIVKVELESLVAVRGKVVDEKQQPISGAMVIATPDRGDGRMMISISSDEPPPTTSSDGSFEVRVKPGKYRLLVLGQEGHMPVVMKPIVVGETDLELGTLEKEAGGGTGMGRPPAASEGDDGESD